MELELDSNARVGMVAIIAIAVLLIVITVCIAMYGASTSCIAIKA